MKKDEKVYKKLDLLKKINESVLLECARSTASTAIHSIEWMNQNWTSKKMKIYREIHQQTLYILIRQSNLYENAIYWKCSKMFLTVQCVLAIETD